MALFYFLFLFYFLDFQTTNSTALERESWAMSVTVREGKGRGILRIPLQKLLSSILLAVSACIL
jgi:hypothetical protein